jgi:hypothetical protein
MSPPHHLGTRKPSDGHENVRGGDDNTKTMLTGEQMNGPLVIVMCSVVV